MNELEQANEWWRSIPLKQRQAIMDIWVTAAEVERLQSRKATGAWWSILSDDDKIEIFKDEPKPQLESWS